MASLWSLVCLIRLCCLCSAHLMFVSVKKFPSLTLQHSQLRMDTDSGCNTLSAASGQIQKTLSAASRQTQKTLSCFWANTKNTLSCFQANPRNIHSCFQENTKTFSAASGQTQKQYQLLQGKHKKHSQLLCPLSPAVHSTVSPFLKQFFFAQIVDATPYHFWTHLFTQARVK